MSSPKARGDDIRQGDGSSPSPRTSTSEIKGTRWRRFDWRWSEELTCWNYVGSGFITSDHLVDTRRRHYIPFEGKGQVFVDGTYMRRWVLETPAFSVRLHHWLKNDDTRAWHDHPWGFVTCVLKGFYYDVSPADPENPGLPKGDGEKNVERMSAGRIRYRRARHKHYVLVGKGGCWTLVLTGPKIRRWGFWLGSKFKKANKFFLEHGQHVCE